MFERIKERKQRELSEKLSMIKPTSKSELKQSCLYLCNLDVKKAQEMYDFLVKDMTELPEIPPAQKTFMDNFKQQSGEIMGWLRENEDMLTKGAEFIKGIFQRKSTPANPLPPINQ